jgi:hypothetical protein
MAEPRAPLEPDLPAPIPWLARPGVVDALDARAAATMESRPAPAPVSAAAEEVPEPARAPVRADSAVLAGLMRRLPFRRRKKKRPGSGIPARKAIRVLVWVRRASQVFFVSLFFFFLFQTAFRGTFAAAVGEPVRLPWPVEGFLLADPFVAAMTFQSTHGV